jgi:hypothetical protein
MTEAEATATATAKAGSGISFELRVSSCELKADALAPQTASWPGTASGMTERKATANVTANANANANAGVLRLRLRMTIAWAALRMTIVGAQDDELVGDVRVGMASEVIVAARCDAYTANAN